MLLSEQRLIEAILNEAIADEGHLIFNSPNLISLAKQVFKEGAIAVHALHPDERYSWSTSSTEAHKLTVRKFFVNEFNVFAQKYNAILDAVKRKRQQILLYNGTDRELRAASEPLNKFKALR